ncbi:MAG TPA: S1 family peptidase [Actinophytocola sp.]|jgi:streptogrisin D|nr:S1 family peptidase [Actinophytocola sp.]
MNLTRKTILRSLTVAAAAAALVPLATTSAQALPAGYGAPVADAAVASLVSTGMSASDALQRLADQPALIARGERLVDVAGASSAGMWLDQHTGSVVVGVVDEQAAAAVRAVGGTARVVEHSTTELESVRDAVAQRQPADTAAGIDVRANQVVVQIGETAKASALAATAARYGDAVRVEHIDGSFRTAISGGDAITGSGGRCSLGFSTTGNTGITAGHCTSAIASWSDPSGAFYGPSVGASFPGNDYGLIRNDGGLAQPGNVNLYNGSFQDITGAGNPTAGMQICKSGSTTGLTCGQVTRTGLQICYAEGCVNNMAESTAAVNPGDSGGAWFAGSTAIGITSGMGGGFSYFQPVIGGLNLFGVNVF